MLSVLNKLGVAKWVAGNGLFPFRPDTRRVLGTRYPTIMRNMAGSSSVF